MTIVLTILGVIALFVPFILMTKWKNRYGNSRFDDIYFFNDKIYMFSNVFHSGGDGDSYTDCRISEIDRKTGETTNILVVSYSKLKVLGEVNGYFWVADDSFAVFDPKTFQIIFKQRDVKEQLEELNDVKISRFYLNKNAKKFFFLAENGYKYKIDTKTLVVQRCNNEETEQSDESEQEIKKTKKVITDTAFRIKKIGKTERYDLYYNENNISEAKSFLQPQFLIDSKTKEIAQLQDPESILLFHCDTTNRMSPFNLSLIDKTGLVRWTITQEQLEVKHNFDSETNAKIEFVNFSSPEIIIVFIGKRDRLVNVDIKNGKINWIVKL